jgi:hypothetical protein
MRAIKTSTSAKVASRGCALVQNIWRGHYELGMDVPAELRLAEASAELAVAIRHAVGTALPTRDRDPQRNKAEALYRPPSAGLESP